MAERYLAMTSREDDGGNLLHKILPPGIDYNDLARVIFDDPDNKDGARAREELKRICRSVYNGFKVPACYSEEDHYQDVSFRFWKNLPNFRGEAKLGTLVYRIARNQLVDMRRKRWQREDPEATLGKDDELMNRLEQHFAPKENVNTTEEVTHRRIYKKELLRNLDEKEYQLFQARYVYGETDEEIAKKSGVTRQAVSKRSSRIVGKLKRINDEASRDSELSDFSDVVTQ